MKGFRDLLEAYYDYRPFKSIIINKIIGNGSKVLNLFGNFIIPIEFILTKPKKNIPIADGTIISMTSFPKRINKLWIVIECLIRQTFRAEKIILYLSKEQFQNKQTLPQKIIDYETNGFLVIKLVEGDIRSHKKYWYALSDFPNKQIITVDDDVLYGPSVIEDLIKASKQNPLSVVGRYCRWIGRNDDGEILPMSMWPTNEVKIGENDMNIFFGSGGGTLYPKGSLYKANQPIEEIKKYCPLADDIWLNAWIRFNGYNVMNVRRKAALPNVINFKNKTLSSMNNGRGMNDKQLFSVVNYFKEKFGENPFSI